MSSSTRGSSAIAAARGRTPGPSAVGKAGRPVLAISDRASAARFCESAPASRAGGIQLVVDPAGSGSGRSRREGTGGHLEPAQTGQPHARRLVGGDALVGPFHCTRAAVEQEQLQGSVSPAPASPFLSGARGRRTVGGACRMGADAIGIFGAGLEVVLG
ncbi:hypothetical protein [Arthrobacter sp.]|uniref:hypothetical protein n=1 Tax=Arthrobacter sp. TaxID=1667 RepID=UPI003A90AEC8